MGSGGGRGAAAIRKQSSGKSVSVKRVFGAGFLQCISGLYPSAWADVVLDGAVGSNATYRPRPKWLSFARAPTFQLAGRPGTSRAKCIPPCDGSANARQQPSV